MIVFDPKLPTHSEWVKKQQLIQVVFKHLDIGSHYKVSWRCLHGCDVLRNRCFIFLTVIISVVCCWYNCSGYKIMWTVNKQSNQNKGCSIRVCVSNVRLVYILGSVSLVWPVLFYYSQLCGDLKARVIIMDHFDVMHVAFIMQWSFE